MPAGPTHHSPERAECPAQARRDGRAGQDTYHGRDGGAGPQARDVTLRELRTVIARLESAGRPCARAPAEFATAQVSAAGLFLPAGALAEVRPATYPDGPAALGLMVALAAGAARTRPGPVIWRDPPRAAGFDWGTLYGPGAQALGLDPERLILLAARREADALWALEEAARAPGVAAVCAVLTGSDAPLAGVRRLQLAAESTGVFLLTARPADAPALPGARTRWTVASAPSAPVVGVKPAAAVGDPVWRVTFEAKGAAARPAITLDLEWNHATHRVCLAAPLADRPLQTGHGAARAQA